MKEERRGDVCGQESSTAKVRKGRVYLETCLKFAQPGVRAQGSGREE